MISNIFDEPSTSLYHRGVDSVGIRLGIPDAIQRYSIFLDFVLGITPVQNAFIIVDKYTYRYF